jgi:hypothetical protein
MSDVYLKKLESSVAEVRAKLVSHPVYGAIKTPSDIKHFMEHHVYAVWDFMSLLKALQIELTCVSLPWLPVGNASTRFLINEIVTGEESDVDELGNRVSHFELYLKAMKQSGADTTAIAHFIDLLQKGASVNEAMQKSPSIPEAALKFMQYTFDVIASGKPHLMAAVFTFGREDLIPDMFISLIKEIKIQFPDTIDVFHYYIERHIEVDGGHHADLAHQMTMELCGTDEEKWNEATEAVKKGLEARLALWDGILLKLN